VTTAIDADAAKACFALPAIAGLSDTYFIRLELKSSSGEVYSINWYWISTHGDELNWKKSNWFTTPQSAFASYSALQSMPKTGLKVTRSTTVKSDSTAHSVTVTNTGKAVAFFVHLRALKGKGGDDVLPLIFSDNYISLAPGESRLIKCTYKTTDAKQVAPYFLTSAWNVDVAKSSGGANEGFETGLPVN
jgi:exo-1,4-beta-D-glucosaminidase